METIDYSAILLTIKLAALSTTFLLLIGTPMAFWLSRTDSWLKTPISAIITLPLVLPPTVIGFYLLIFLGPKGPLGHLTESIGIGYLPFTFSGLVVGSIVYSLPFVIQPIQSAFETIGNRPLEVAATLRAGPVDRFFTVVVPQARSGFLTATVLGFAHTIGEFGVVLMIGGNIPGKTRVVSVAIFDHVETLEYGNAHVLSAGMLIFSFFVLYIMYSRKRPMGLGL